MRAVDAARATACPLAARRQPAALRRRSAALRTHQCQPLLQRLARQPAATTPPSLRPGWRTAACRPAPPTTRSSATSARPAPPTRGALGLGRRAEGQAGAAERTGLRAGQARQADRSRRPPAPLACPALPCPAVPPLLQHLLGHLRADLARLLPVGGWAQQQHGHRGAEQCSRPAGRAGSGWHAGQRPGGEHRLWALRPLVQPGIPRARHRPCPARLLHSFFGLKHGNSIFFEGGTVGQVGGVLGGCPAARRACLAMSG